MSSPGNFYNLGKIAVWLWCRLIKSKRLLNYILCIRFFSGMHSIVSASQFPYTNLSQGCH